MFESTCLKSKGTSFWMKWPRSSHVHHFYLFAGLWMNNLSIIINNKEKKLLDIKFFSIEWTNPWHINERLQNNVCKNCILIWLWALIIRGLMKLMARLGIVWWAERLEVALRIYLVASSSSMWIPWSFSSLRTEETAPKALKRPSEFARKVNQWSLFTSSGDTIHLQRLRIMGVHTILW